MILSVWYFLATVLRNAMGAPKSLLAKQMALYLTLLTILLFVMLTTGSIIVAVRRS